MSSNNSECSCQLDFRRWKRAAARPKNEKQRQNSQPKQQLNNVRHFFSSCGRRPQKFFQVSKKLRIQVDFKCWLPTGPCQRACLFFGSASSFLFVFWLGMKFEWHGVLSWCGQLSVFRNSHSGSFFHFIFALTISQPAKFKTPLSPVSLTALLILLITW